MLVVSRDSEKGNPAVKMAEKAGTVLTLSGLGTEGMLQYICNILRVQDIMVPHDLRKFVGLVTLGNPMYIRETLYSLVDHLNLAVAFDNTGKAKNLECKDLDLVELA